MEKQIYVQRRFKTVYREGDRVVKAFVPDYPQSAVLKEAFNHALAVEAGLNVPRLLGVYQQDGGWCLAVEAIEGRTLEEAMKAEPEKMDAWMDLLVEEQSRIHATTCKQMARLKDKLNAQISGMKDAIPATERYELHVRLEMMKPHTKMTHGDFNPGNIILGTDGKVYVIDWAHAAIGNASADAAMTYLIFALEDQRKADLYLKKFCVKNDIAMQYVQKWLPIVAAAQLSKHTGEAYDRLREMAQIVEFE